MITNKGIAFDYYGGTVADNYCIQNLEGSSTTFFIAEVLNTPFYAALPGFTLLSNALLADHFIAIASIYVMVSLTVLHYNVRNLNVQKTLSEVITFILIASCVLLLNDDIFTDQALHYGNNKSNDLLAFLAKILLCFFASLYFFVVADFLNDQKIINYTYLVILTLATAGLLLLCSCHDLLTAYLAIELTSLSSYAAAAFRKDSNHSAEAGVKYFIIGSTSSAIFLLGASAVYACSGSVFFNDLTNLFLVKGEYSVLEKTEASALLESAGLIVPEPSRGSAGPQTPLGSTYKNSINEARLEQAKATVLYWMDECALRVAAYTLIPVNEWEDDLMAEAGLPAYEEQPIDFSKSRLVYRGGEYRGNLVNIIELPGVLLSVKSNIEKEEALTKEIYALRDARYKDIMGPYKISLPPHLKGGVTLQMGKEDTLDWISRFKDDWWSDWYCRSILLDDPRPYSEVHKTDICDCPDSVRTVLGTTSLLVHKNIYGPPVYEPMVGWRRRPVPVCQQELFQVLVALDFSHSREKTLWKNLIDARAASMVALKPYLISCSPSSLFDSDPLLEIGPEATLEQAKTTIRNWLDEWARRVVSQVIGFEELPLDSGKSRLVRWGWRMNLCREPYPGDHGKPADEYELKGVLSALLSSIKEEEVLTEKISTGRAASVKALAPYRINRCPGALFAGMAEEIGPEAPLEKVKDTIHSWLDGWASRVVSQVLGLEEPPVDLSKSRLVYYWDEEVPEHLASDAFGNLVDEYELGGVLSTLLLNMKEEEALTEKITTLKAASVKVMKPYAISQGPETLFENMFEEMGLEATLKQAKDTTRSWLGECASRIVTHTLTPVNEWEVNLLAEAGLPAYEEQPIDLGKSRLVYQSRKYEGNLVDVGELSGVLLALTFEIERAETLFKEISASTAAILKALEPYLIISGSQTLVEDKLLETGPEAALKQVKALITDWAAGHTDRFVSEVRNGPPRLTRSWVEEPPRQLYESLLVYRTAGEGGLGELISMGELRDVLWAVMPNIERAEDSTKKLSASLAASLEVLEPYLINSGLTPQPHTHFFKSAPLGLIKVGAIFITFSVFIKLALAPFHQWSVDVYEGSSTSATFFFTVITKLSLFIFLIRFCYTVVLNFSNAWQFYALGTASLSVLVGSVGGLRLRKLKALLAYSSISHMGYIALAVCSISLFGAQVTLFYLIVYMISGVCLWHTLMLLRVKTGSNTKYSKELGDLASLKKSNPAFAFSLALTLFSLAGLPPLAGFLSKFGVLLALTQEKFYFVCAAAILCNVVSAFYYLRVIKVTSFENTLVGKLLYPVKTNKAWLLSFFNFYLIFLLARPDLLNLHIQKAVSESLAFT